MSDKYQIYNKMVIISHFIFQIKRELNDIMTPKLKTDLIPDI